MSIEKTEIPNLIKDNYSKALLSTDIRGLRQHLLQKRNREKAKLQEGDLNNIKSEIADLRDDLGEIKDILSQLLNK
jgi:hypothetical protein